MKWLYILAAIGGAILIGYLIHDIATDQKLKDDMTLLFSTKVSDLTFRQFFGWLLITLCVSRWFTGSNKSKS